MEGKDKLLAQDTPLDTIERSGINVPSLIKENMLAGEQENDHESDGKESIKVGDSRKEKKHQDCVKHENDSAAVDKEESKELGAKDEFLETDTHESNDELCGKEDHTGCGEHSRSENGKSSEHVVKIKKEKERAENTRNQDEGKIEKAQSNEKNNKGNETQQKDGGKVKGDPFEEIYHDDGDNDFNRDESGGRKEGLRKTRFSSEVRIEPRAYFQAGNDAVVTLPPPSPSNDVFHDDKNHSSSKSSHVILNAKPTDRNRAVYPATFFPLTVLSCMFCCPMIGLFAIYRSYKVKKLVSQGDFYEAREASEHARQLGVLTLIIGLFFVLAIITIAVLVSTLA